MDDRFPKYIRWLANKLEFVSIQNWAFLISGLAIMAFIAQMMPNIDANRFILDPYRVMQGEYWRLFAFPAEVSGPIWLLLFVYVTYFFVSAVEQEWGPAPLTLYILIGYIATVGASFLLGIPIRVWHHILFNITLAFGTLFPTFEIMLFFILPVKAMWIAMFAGGMLLFDFFRGLAFFIGFGPEGSQPYGFVIMARVVLVTSPYLLFFGPMLVTNVKYRIRSRNHRKRFDDGMWK